MRVIIVNDFARVNGGAGKVAIDSALALAAAGVATHIFAAALTADPSYEGLANLTVTALGRSHVNSLSRSKKLFGGIWDASIGAAFDRLLSAYSPKDTVVHVHSLRDANTLAILKPILHRGFPWLFTAHDYMLACPYSGFYDHELEEICTRKPLGLACVASRCNDGSRLARMWFLIRFVAQRMSGLPTRLPHVIIANGSVETILRPFLPKDCVVHRLEIPIDFVPAPRVEAERNDAFLFLGRFSREKGASVFAEAARKAGVRAVFVGSGEEEETIRALNPDAEHLGWVDADGAREAIRSARALVFPSRWYETFGMSAAEAVAAGVPALVSDASVTGEIPLQYGSGAIFPSGDVDALAALLRKVDDDDALVAEWSRTGYERYAQDPLTMNRHVTGLLAIYERVLADPVRP